MRNALLAGATVMIVVVIAVVWPADPPASTDTPVPNPPTPDGVEPPWHILAPQVGEPVEMTRPPRPLNAAEVQEALLERTPASLRGSGLGGTATIWLEIDEAGRVASAELGASSGFTAFDTVALNAVRLARFEPAYDGDEPVAVRLEYEIPLVAGDGSALGPDLDLSRRTVELVAVYLGATPCAPCMEESTKEAVRRILARAAAEADARGFAFQAVGAAFDRDIDAGLELLASTAGFDQVVVGGSWSNTAAVEFIWSQDSVRAAIPHVVILTRAIDRSVERREPTADHVFVRLQGGNAMREWLEAGGRVF